MPTAAPAVASGAAYAKAPLGGRLLAYIADSIVAATLLPLGTLLVMAGGARDEVSIAGLLVSALGALWMLGYLIARDAAGGAGFGKRLTGLVVVSAETGVPAKAGPAIVRQIVMWALGLIPAIGSLIEPILVLVDKDGRRLGDKAAKTQVVRSADVAARGVPVAAGKGAAIAVVVGALVLNIVGSTIGGIVFARAAFEGADGWESVGTGFDDGFGNGAGTDPWSEQPQVETPPPAQPPEGNGWDGQMPDTSGSEYVSAVNAETAVDAVGNMLWSLQQDDVDRARSYASRYFQEDGEWFFYPASNALYSFEVVDVYQDAASWTVVVEENWNSGPETVIYFVIEEDNQARVDGIAWADEF